MSIEESSPQNFQQVVQEQLQTPENKRRKAEEIERVYVCQYKKCQKSYGSYPALYTHIKLKHSNSFKKGKSQKLPQKNLKYIKKITFNKSPQISTTQSTPQVNVNFFNSFIYCSIKEQSIIKQLNEPKLIKKNLPELYEDLLFSLHTIQFLQDSKSQEQQQSFTSTEEFPQIQTLNSDILSPLKSQLLQLKSPQTFVRNSVSSIGVQQKLAELLAYLGPKIKQELYSEFCYLLGFFAKCIWIRRIQSISGAEEDFEEIYQYIHDSISFCTTFRFRYLKNGKILENKDELMHLTKKIINNIILITFQKSQDEKILPPFILA